MFFFFFFFLEMTLFSFLCPAALPLSAENRVCTAHLKGRVLALCHRYVALLISPSSAVAEETGDTTANHKACYCQHCSKPHWHRFLCAWVVPAFSGEAVDIREDVRMLLKTHTQSKMISLTLKHDPDFDRVPLSQMRVSSDVFHYLSGALDVVFGICEIVICLFSPHRLQLWAKQRTALASRSLVKQASAKPFISPDSPCYSTELQPWKRVPARRNGNSPLRRRCYQGCSPGKKILIRSVFVHQALRNWSTFAWGQCSEEHTAFSGTTVLWKKGCTTAAKSSLPS